MRRSACGPLSSAPVGTRPASPTRSRRVGERPSASGRRDRPVSSAASGRLHGPVSSRQWWRNGRIGGLLTTSYVHHLWRPSTSENNFLSRNLAEPVAAARLCCARAPAHRHVAPWRPRSELLTWQRLRCPKGSCIGKRGEGRWWVRSPANSRTSFSKGQKDYRKFDTDSLESFKPLRGGASGGPKESVSIIAVLELTSLYPPRPDASSSFLR